MKGLLHYCLVPLLFIANNLHAAPEAKTQAGNQAPFCFIENKGQIIDQHNKTRADIDFKISLPGINIFIGNGQLHYQWSKSNTATKQPEDRLHPERKCEALPQQTETEIYRLDVALLNAHITAPVVATDKQSYTENYYLPQCHGKVANSYKTITYQNVYPNIDWVLYAKDNHLKYDFVVHPGGNPKQIKLQYKGATDMQLAAGNVKVSTPFGNIEEQKPYTFYSNGYKTIASSYTLKENVLSFDIANYNTTEDIVIDPTINWATYYGGGNYDECMSTASDAGANIFMGGSTQSTNNIATTGAYQTTLAGTTDGFVVKFSPDGSRDWATYYGGTANERFFGICTDAAGNVYASGESFSSSGIATSGAHQDTLCGIVGRSDAVLIKFNTSGTLLWGTYYGGERFDQSFGITCDNSGNVYMTGTTQSPTNISSGPSVYQPAINSAVNSEVDGFIVKFNSSGVRQWGTYYGGELQDYVSAITTDATGNLYIVGHTNSQTGISSSSGVHQPSFGSTTGWDDGFLVKMNSSGARQWSTYYGGNWHDVLNSVGCDLSGNVYVCGTTESTNNIATVSAYQTTNGGQEAMVAKFNSSGTIQWGTYYGGGYEYGAGIAVRPDGIFYLAGGTYSSTGIASGTTPYQSSLNGMADYFLTEWSTSGTPSYGTYFGGNDYDYAAGGWAGSSITYSPSGYVSFCGLTESTTGLATANGFQTAHGGGNYDGFLASFVVDTMVYINRPFYDTLFCAGDTLRLPYGVSAPFKSTNTFTVQLSDATGSFTSPTNIGTLTATDADTITCVLPTTATGTGYRVRIVASSPVRTSADDGWNIRIKPLPTGVSASDNSPVCEGTTISLAGTASAGTGIISYSWQGVNGFTSTVQNPSIFPALPSDAGYHILTATSDGCSVKDTITTTILPQPAMPLAGNSGPVCPYAATMLSANSTTPGVSYTWTGPGFTSNLQNPIIGSILPANAGTYTVYAVGTNGCYSPAGTTVLQLKPVVPSPVAGANTPMCTGSNLMLTASTVAGATYQWTGPLNYSSPLQNPIISTITPAQAGIYEVTATLAGCTSLPSSINVTVNTVAFIGGYASPNDTICAGTLPTFVALPANGGPSPVYQWYKNLSPVPGANGLRYADPSVTDGDRYYCTMYSIGICPDPVNASTDTITMTVQQVTTQPHVSIISVPAQPLPGNQTTFTAQPVNGGYQPQFKWLHNGIEVFVASSAIWTTNNLAPYDEIRAIVITSDPCANIPADTSDPIIVNFATAVSNVPGMPSMKIYPNPNNGDFTLIGEANTSVMSIEIFNVTGQLIYSSNTYPKNGSINQLIHLDGKFAAGMYLIKVNSEGEKKNIPFILYR
ncbi:MAG: T9SS type A sorting domain-containing protein [Sphingobacteriales bacterium]|nr:MAG: T9SS type A sorting domain-containing protein [Sphingobacteriales bacterium]